MATYNVSFTATLSFAATGSEDKKFTAPLTLSADVRTPEPRVSLASSFGIATSVAATSGDLASGRYRY